MAASLGVQREGKTEKKGQLFLEMRAPGASILWGRLTGVIDYHRSLRSSGMSRRGARDRKMGAGQWG